MSESGYQPNLCHLYWHQLARVYGVACAEASIVEQHNGSYLINVSVEGPEGYELRGLAQPHTEAQVQRMIDILSQRRPKE
ncbi:MAG: hypothetical protein ABID84_03580 [Chloroflexota bacterium]